ncbi:hypothetical protein F8388_018868 [Cannabis sativa]|uniref:Uncharacterized protein n=1 Tax=Cannabis sativa TaxID=3483 RepID=A0A7J6G2D8_CANSA|nr:hypothetical protein F8388_018868 [Cannabis sativa]
MEAEGYEILKLGDKNWRLPKRQTRTQAQSQVRTPQQQVLDLDGKQGHREWLPLITPPDVAPFAPEASPPQSPESSTLAIKPCLSHLEPIVGDAWTRAEDLSREQNLVDWAKPFLKDAHKVDPRLEGQYSIEGARKAAALAHQCLSHQPQGSRVTFVYVVPTELGREEKVDHDDEDVVLMSSRSNNNNGDNNSYQREEKSKSRRPDDYCPSLKLEESDFVMPRKNFPLWRLIANDPLLIKAKIHEWSDGEEFQKVLLKLINTISTGDHEIESDLVRRHQALHREDKLICFVILMTWFRIILQWDLIRNSLHSIAIRKNANDGMRKGYEILKLGDKNWRPLQPNFRKGQLLLKLKVKFELHNNKRLVHNTSYVLHSKYQSLNWQLNLFLTIFVFELEYGLPFSEIGLDDKYSATGVGIIIKEISENVFGLRNRKMCSITPVFEFRARHTP